MKRFLVIDFEYREGNGRLHPVCLVGQDLQTGQIYRQWLDDTQATGPAFPCDEDTVLIAHSITIAEANCWDVLGWHPPGAWIDTFTEARVLDCGTKNNSSYYSLLHCCKRFGIPTIESDDKDAMRDLVLHRDAYTEEEKEMILTYCGTDVEASVSLFHVLARDPRFNLKQAMLRGRYLAECSKIMNRGIPIDMSRFALLTACSNAEMREVIAEIHSAEDIAPKGKWSSKVFERLVQESGIPWPRSEKTNRFKSDNKTLKRMSELYGEPWLKLARIRADLSEALIGGLAPRSDGRLIANLCPLATMSGRCAPKIRGFIMGKPKWLRFLVQPPEGRTIIVADWKSQEYAIAAALSGDEGMIASYLSGDPYLDLGRRCGKIPLEGTKETHPDERGRFKIVSLAVLMGMKEASIGLQTGLGTVGGAELLRMHKRAFPKFWEWSDKCEDNGAAARDLETSFGLYFNPESEGYSPLTARNFLLQATGSDMLRVAVLLLGEAGIEVIATVHDSIMVECDTSDAEEVQKLLVACMEQASGLVLHDTLTIEVDVQRIDHPNHYFDEKGADFFRKMAERFNIPLDEREMPN